MEGLTHRVEKEALEYIRKINEMEGLILHRISIESRFIDSSHKIEKAEDGKEKTNVQ